MTIPILRSKREHQLKLKKRLDAIADLPTNRTCSECPESKPTWASLLMPPTGGDNLQKKKKKHNRLGVLCCFKCYSYHFQMGKDVCRVKNIKMVEEWSEEDIEALERGGGNTIVNFIYEANLCPSAYDKQMILQDAEADAIARKQFIRNKYQELLYFDAGLYQMQMRETEAVSTSLSPMNKKPKPTKVMSKRSHSFDDVAPSRSPGPKKPLRKSSQSFQEFTEDDTDEDDTRLSYNLPGHLAVPKPTQQNQRARSSTKNNRASKQRRLPSRERNRNASTETQRRQRRRSSSASATPSKVDIGYGCIDGSHHSTATEVTYSTAMDDSRASSCMDATTKQANGSRRSNDGSTFHAPQAAGACPSFGKNHRRSSMGASRPARRCSCKSTAPRVPQRVVSDSSGEDSDVGTKKVPNLLNSAAPRMPQRLVSDESGDDSDVALRRARNAESLGKMRRRLSLPSYARQNRRDEESIDSIEHQHGGKKYSGIDAYSPQVKRTAQRGLLETTRIMPRLGVKMGYGFDGAKSSDSEQETNQARRRCASTGDKLSVVDAPALGCFLATSKEQPQKILDEHSLGSGTKSSNEEIVGIGPSRQARKPVVSAGVVKGQSGFLGMSASLSNHLSGNKQPKARKLADLQSVGGCSGSSEDSGFSFESKSSGDSIEIKGRVAPKSRKEWVKQYIVDTDDEPEELLAFPTSDELGYGSAEEQVEDLLAPATRNGASPKRSPEDDEEIEWANGKEFWPEDWATDANPDLSETEKSATVAEELGYEEGNQSDQSLNASSLRRGSVASSASFKSAEQGESLHSLALRRRSSTASSYKSAHQGSSYLGGNMLGNGRSLLRQDSSSSIASESSEVSINASLLYPCLEGTAKSGQGELPNMVPISANDSTSSAESLQRSDRGNPTARRQLRETMSRLLSLGTPSA